MFVLTNNSDLEKTIEIDGKKYVIVAKIDAFVYSDFIETVKENVQEMVKMLGKKINELTQKDLFYLAGEESLNLWKIVNNKPNKYIPIVFENLNGKYLYEIEEIK